MEIFPNLRLLQKRYLVCLYLACVTFLVCAIYTFRKESVPQYTAYNYDSTFSDTVYKAGDKKLLVDNHKIHSAINRMDNLSFSSKINSSSSHFMTGQSTPNFILKPINRTYFKRMKLDTKYIDLAKENKTCAKLPNVLFKQTTLSPDNCNAPSMKNTKVILLWTPFFDKWKYFQQERLNSCTKCRNCRITHDRRELAESDAIVFHVRDMSLADLPKIRYPHQRWIFYCLESPPYSDFPGMQHMVNMFNWTMTYRTDSDIVLPYGSISRVRPSRKLDFQSLQSSFNRKTKSVVWMSSHCPTHGGRDDYVKELRQYIDVDVFGSCGEFYCPPSGTEKCLQHFASEYKFFLAFENTICKDYVTEKFFRTLKYNIIPVVFGGATYSNIAPPGSFIDALSFKSPKHLAYFLNGVGNDFKIYSTYFKWKEDYIVNPLFNKECDLCAKLHRSDLKTSSYGDFRKWWVSNSQCKTWKSKL